MPQASPQSRRRSATGARGTAAPRMAAVEERPPASRMDPELWRTLGRDPGAEMEAILVSADGLEALLAELPAEVTVAHTYRLINSVAVRATAAAIRGLLRLPVIQRIEGVRPVAACEPAAD